VDGLSQITQVSLACRTVLCTVPSGFPVSRCIGIVAYTLRYGSQLVLLPTVVAQHFSVISYIRIHALGEQTHPSHTRSFRGLLIFRSFYTRILTTHYNLFNHHPVTLQSVLLMNTISGIKYLLFVDHHMTRVGQVLNCTEV